MLCASTTRAALPRFPQIDMQCLSCGGLARPCSHFCTNDCAIDYAESEARLLLDHRWCSGCAQWTPRQFQGGCPACRLGLERKEALPDCWLCTKKPALPGSYFCSQYCAAWWAQDHLEISKNNAWCPKCKAWGTDNVSPEFLDDPGLCEDCGGPAYWPSYWKYDDDDDA